MAEVDDYDSRYLAGIVLFNRGDYFEAHEVWEDWWMEHAGPEKQFIQGLIQVAVGICHFCNGNVRGAVKLYHSSRDYLQAYDSPTYGLDLNDFLKRLELCFSELLHHPQPDVSITPDENLLPEIELVDPPDEWPEVSVFLTDD